jgi:hypothetical protein
MTYWLDVPVLVVVPVPRRRSELLAGSNSEERSGDDDVDLRASTSYRPTNANECFSANRWIELRYGINAGWALINSY